MNQYREMEKLPPDVMLEILSRVPARSVGRFRTLSKLYADLLSQPSFIKKHLSHAGVKLLVHKAEYSHDRRLDSFLHYPLDNTLTYTPEENVKSTDPVTLVGSCNGLFCIVSFKDSLVTLWNPTTRESGCLTQLPHYEKSRYYSRSYNYSFGYDSLNDDYKFVWVICDCYRINSETSLPNITYIYSQRGRCWKEIEQTLPPFRIQISCAEDYRFVHGKIHWVAYTSVNENGTQCNQFIVSLDLATERYGIVPRPPSDHPSDDLEVCALGGELCFYINPDDPMVRGFEMWIMREYAVEQSWFRLLTIPIRNVTLLHNTYVPIFMMKSGEILLQAQEHDGSSICLYNPTTCNFIIVDHDKDDSSGYIYKESLVETKHRDFLL